MIKAKWWILVVTLAVFFVSSFAKAGELHDAAERGDVNRVKQLLNAGVDVNAKNNDYGSTALIVTSTVGHTEVVKILLEKGADVNSENKYGDTALMGAAAAGQTKIVKALLQKGANVNTKNKYGWSALMMAVKKGHTEVVNLLKQAGAK